MRTTSRFLAVFLGLGLLWLMAAPAAADKDDAARIDKLIEQLGSGSFQEREAATKALDALGAPALEKLKKASQSDDVEVSRRATELVKRIEKRTEVSRVLTPKRVHLIYKDTPLKEAVEDFKKKSGYDFTLHDPENKLADRKVTLDSGDVPFWEAFDQFCDKAGLVQATPQEMMQLMMREMMERQKEMMERMKLAPPAQAPGLPVPPAKKPEVKQAPAEEERQTGLKPGEKKEAPAKEKKEAPTKQVEKKEAPAKPAEKRGAAGGVPQALPLQQPPPAAALPGQAMRTRFGGHPMMGTNQLVLMDGKAKLPPTHYAGAVRIRAITNPDQPAGGKDAPLNIGLQVSAEPKLQVRSIVSTRIDKAVNDNGQSLSTFTAGDEDPNVAVGAPVPPGAIIRGRLGSMTMPMMGGPDRTIVQLKKGEKPSKSLKELKGTIAMQMLDAPQALITVDKVLKASGTMAKGKDGGYIKIVEATKTEEGQVKVRLEMEIPQDVIAGQTGGMAWGDNMPVPGIRILPAAVPPPAPLPPAKEKAAPPAEKPKEAPADKPKEAPAKADKDKVKEQVKQPPPPPAPAPAAAAPVVAFRATPLVGGPFAGLTLVDEKGKNLPLVNAGITGRAAAAAGGPPVMEYELTFQPQKDQGDPAKLVFTGSRMVTIEIPFTLKDVPLK
jgi:hypothetical protein